MIFVKRSCKYCGKGLTSNKTAYCNNECRKLFENGDNYKRICRVCNEEFIGNRVANICAKCKIVKSNCVYCGKEISGAKSKKYCSRSCQNKNAAKNICTSCGVEFKGGYNAKYCSNECYRKIRIKSLKDEKMSAIEDIIKKHTNLKLNKFNLLNLDFRKTEKFKCINNHIIKANLNQLSRLDKVECDICNYNLNPKSCLNCGKILPYEKRNNTFCSNQCNSNYSTNKSIKDQREFELYYNKVLCELFTKGYSELKVAEITNLKFSNIKSFILKRPELKQNLCLLDDEIVSIIKGNNKINFRDFGFTRTASQYFKEQHASFVDFVSKNNLNIEEKLFKCGKCNQFHNLNNFSNKKQTIKQSYFGIGICKNCVKSEKIKRRGKSNKVDKLLTSEYLNYIKNTFDNKCAICDENNNLHIDHFIPLSWNNNRIIKGNYILLCEKCNSHLKRDLNYIDWIDKYEDINYKTKLNNILIWLSNENNMTLDEYENLYWEAYNKKVNREKTKK